MIDSLSMLSRVSPGGFDIARTAPPAPAAAPGTASFDAVLGETMTRAVDRLEHAEAMSLKAIRGEAETRDVADAVMSAEQSLQAAIAIRDKLVTAFLEVSRMQI
jgi:flagellar hook-basal body complex protein FliE